MTDIKSRDCHSSPILASALYSTLDPSLSNPSSLSDTTMSFKLPAKRSRESSITSVSTSRSKSHLSSHSRSSPALAANPLPSPQPKRVSLRPPSSRQHSTAASNRAASTAPSSHFHDPEAEDDGAIDEREENDSLNEVIMAVDVKGRGNVGCSYYVAREENLYFMEDVKLGELEVVETCEYLS